MKKLSRSLLVGLLGLYVVLLAAPVFAQEFPRDLTLTWTNPDQNTDGSAISDGELDTFTARCIDGGGAVVVDVTQPITAGPGGGERLALDDVIPGPGEYTCSVYITNVDNVSSDPAEVTRGYNQPGPVRNLTITITITISQ